MEHRRRRLLLLLHIPMMWTDIGPATVVSDLPDNARRNL